MSPDVPSNVRVFVRWNDSTVFAGEDIKCKITFKNIAVPPNQRTTQTSSLVGTPRHKATTSNGSLAPPPAFGRSRGHRSTLSLNVPSTSSRARNAITQWTPQQQPQPQANRPKHTHQRSLSIVSMGSTATVEDSLPSNGIRGHSARAIKGHGRSTSLQISPRSSGALNGSKTAMLPPSPLGDSPIFNNHSFPPSRRSSGRSTMPNTPGMGSQASRRGSGQMPDWKFPAAPSPLGSPRNNSVSVQGEDYLTTPVSGSGGTATLPVRRKESIQSIPVIAEHPAPAARILSTTSAAGGTPRSSGEFYSLSNNSSETLASEYVTQPLRSGSVRQSHLRQTSGMLGNGSAKVPENLMMGYAQIQGSFTLDGSLINLGPFENVKRKAVLSGQGGGVIGLEPSKRDSGLLKSFGWGSWGNSIGELLGGGELSSIKEMRNVASSRSIPLLSTPQSILFVDLRLAPGESRTYEYSFRLPKGLPPTHRGKAMKISYSLIIGTQRPGGTREQQVRSVDVPFRVLGSVNNHGEILGHDLMSPYIITSDRAQVQVLKEEASSTELRKRAQTPQPGNTLNGFMAYVDELLEGSRDGLGLLSPTVTKASSRRPSVFEDAATAKEAIDLAILRSNLTTSETGQSTNRFEISRNGQRVGVVMLARPAYRLGESVNMVIDFTNAETQCYAVHAALETAERIDASLALRSEASVHRVTRKVYASSSEATLFARRVVFSPTIPITATPEFVTTGIALEWKIRIEFVVPSSLQEAATRDELDDEYGEEGGGGGGGKGPHPLLEEISNENKGGLVLVAAENLECESFEIAVPIRVYGAVCNGLERLERDEAEEGLPV